VINNYSLPDAGLVTAGDSSSIAFKNFSPMPRKNRVANTYAFVKKIHQTLKAPFLSRKPHRQNACTLGPTYCQKGTAPKNNYGSTI
jgi:hypothetical protein